MSEQTQPPDELVASHAQAVLDGLAGQGPPGRHAALRQSGGLAALVLVFPFEAGRPVPRLSECDADCLYLLAQRSQPISGKRARREMERCRIGIYGEATVKRSLARLKAMGLVSNSRRSPRGYYLAEMTPFIRELLSGNRAG